MATRDHPLAYLYVIVIAHTTVNNTWGETMPSQFNSWWDFIQFEESVRQRNRFFHEPRVTEFLDTLLQTCGSRHKTIQEGQSLWRAQLGNATCQRSDIHEDVEVVYDEEIPYPAERMKPLPYAAHEGRANPRGIPCLYVASDPETAMSEVRPWLGANISIGQFTLKKEVTLIDFSVGHAFSGTHFIEEPTPAEREATIWTQIDKTFSEPASNDKGSAEYVPTQVISEFFRKQGFDGVVYKSSLGPGHNFALFDLDAAALVNCAVRSAKGITFDFGPPRQEYNVHPNLNGRG